MKQLQLFLLAAMAVLMLSCQKEANNTTDKGVVQLQFTNMAGANPLALNTTITNAFGERLTITKYKYYISNITLTDERDLRRLVPDTYFLVDESNADSKTFNIEVPAGSCQSISFLIGVDSMRNVSGAQTGALDPLHDMFWTWNTGYIMAKMEGTSPASALPNEKVEYHTGGFKGEHSVLRTVTIPFSQAYTLQKDGRLQVAIKADVLKWFDGVHPLSIATSPTATSPGALAARFADNYASMFTLTSVQPQ